MVWGYAQEFWGSPRSSLFHLSWFFTNWYSVLGVKCFTFTLPNIHLVIVINLCLIWPFFCFVLSTFSAVYFYCVWKMKDEDGSFRCITSNVRTSKLRHHSPGQHNHDHKHIKAGCEMLSRLIIGFWNNPDLNHIKILPEAC